MSANWWEAYPTAEPQVATNWWEAYPQAEPPESGHQSANELRRGSFIDVAWDAAKTVVGGLAGTTLGGLNAIGQTMVNALPFNIPGIPKGDPADAVRVYQERFGHQPQTQQVVSAIETAAPVLTLPQKAGEAAGEAYLELTGSPLAATIAHTLVEGAPDIIGLKGLRATRPGRAPEVPELQKPAKATIPTAEELTAAAKEAYQRAREAGAVAAPESFARMARGLRESLREQGFNPRLHPKAAAVLDEIEGAGGKPVSLDEIEILRRQALAAERSIEADERRVAGLIIDRLDDYADALASGAEPVIGGNAPAAVAARKQARNLYARSRKAMEIQELIERAQIRASQLSGSGEENALRTEFRQLAMNPKRMRRFTKEEQQAIKEVAFGTKASNALRQLGKLAPTGGLSQWLSIGATMINPLAVTVPLAGSAARIGATHLTRGAAQRAQELMRRGPLRAPEPEAPPAQAMVGEIMPREPQQPAALPFRPAPEPAPIVVDAMGRAGSAADMAAFQTEMGLAGLRGVRQPRAEPVPGQNLFSQLAREQQIDRAGAAFEAERAAAAARGGIEVQEAPRSAVREITLEGEPQNRLGRLAPKPISSTEAIRSLVRRVAERPSDNTHKVIAYEDAVHPAAIEAFMQGGVDVRDYTHVIDSSAVRHILKRHGNKQKEQVRGQLPITEDDLTRLPEIIGNPDAVEYAGKTRGGREAVRYAKVLGDEIVVVEEARTGRKQLAVTSMWKVTRDESMPSVKTQSPLLRPERLRGTLPQRADRNTFAELIEMSGSSVRRQRVPIEHISTNAFEQLGERP